jgi:hypothetical protein
VELLSPMVTLISNFLGTAKVFSRVPHSGGPSDDRASADPVGREIDASS